jgi:hypothetical protein
MCVENARVTTICVGCGVVENVNLLKYKKPSSPITVFRTLPILFLMIVR